MDKNKIIRNYFLNLKEKKLYFDLNIFIDKNSINVHSSFVCEQSELIKMLYSRKSKEYIKLAIPGDLGHDDIARAINYLYNPKIDDYDSNDILRLIVALNYLLVDITLVINILADVICKNVISDEIIFIAKSIIKYYNLPIDHPIIKYFGKDVIENDNSNNLLFYNNNNSEMQFLNRETYNYHPSAVISKNMVLDSKWVHIEYLKPMNTRYPTWQKYDEYKFDAFGYNFEVVGEYTNYYTDGDSYSQLITVHDPKNELCLNIRCIVYYLHKDPEFDILTEIDNRKIPKLNGFKSFRVIYDHKNPVRISYYIEKLMNVTQ